MNMRTFSSAAKIWAVLVGLTLLSVYAVEDAVLGHLTTFGVILIAGIKARLVILDYMEARHAPPRWRFLYETWNFAAMAIIAIGYFVANTPPPVA